ncbi:hypothetical protein [Niallia sp. NCCP-28]|uniref:hypothetical protein n=1 Tax=Niallia sp. NCCP-28 TaxID=2934712 RepID=UPI0020C04A3E|nr:hypothetical protein [Niallia sp. NCCP-28]
MYHLLSLMGTELIISGMKPEMTQNSINMKKFSNISIAFYSSVKEVLNIIGK